MVLPARPARVSKPLQSGKNTRLTTPMFECVLHISDLYHTRGSGLKMCYDRPHGHIAKRPRGWKEAHVDTASRCLVRVQN